jgi:hypothetical protein
MNSSTIIPAHGNKDWIANLNLKKKNRKKKSRKKEEERE